MNEEVQTWIETAEENAEMTGTDMYWMRNPRFNIPARISIKPEKKASVTAL